MVRRFVRVLLTLVVMGLGLWPTGAVLAAPTTPTVAVYNCEASDYDQLAANATSERGPPTTDDQGAPLDPGGCGSRGASVRPSVRAPVAYDAHDLPAQFVQVDSTVSMTAGLSAAIDGDLSGLQPAGVAAKTGGNLPTVNWGQQAKHFPGHPNFIPGRSTMTANPEALIQRAGTGTPVNKVPRGEAGFKERIDFVDDIGTYVTQDGVSSPTSIGILHYRADGSVHIVPGRPQ